MKNLRNVIPMVMFITCLIFCNENLSAASNPTDREISNAVSNELTFNATTPSYLIDVTTYEGIVTLSGSVNNIGSILI